MFSLNGSLLPPLLVPRLSGCCGPNMALKHGIVICLPRSSSTSRKSKRFLQYSPIDSKDVFVTSEA
ncbi:hypothetical protein GIB67_003338 [Kingdonia uniflora]|uniref:Uncharacterized protein n=1 Tax=Kingdonia uniflora TaxID=39325 RepID=A0A7J7P933_9MAGN|nr:hypothetical protein GIB67_003338 [Kingdonia uniflora]